MIDIAGRRVKVQNGSRSQTVNVCTAPGVAGQYDWKVRLAAGRVSEGELAAQRFDSIDALVRYLQGLGGDVELSPIADADRSARGPSRVAAEDPAPAAVEWARSTHEVAERCIDQLVQEFCERPYLHRVEHSIHCRLYELLMATQEFREIVSFAGWETQCVHKEWPEHIARPEKGNRRGNFDLAILPPSEIRAASLAQFRQGRIRPGIVIELGLDYGISHLAGDVQKLHNSGIEHSYLVHLSRKDTPLDPGAERLLLDGGIRGAYAHHLGDRVRFSLVGDAEVREMRVG